MTVSPKVFWIANASILLLMLPLVAFSVAGGSVYLSFLPFAVLLLVAGILEARIMIAIIFASFLATNRVLFYPGHSAVTVTTLFLLPLFGVLFVPYLLHGRSSVEDVPVFQDKVRHAFQKSRRFLILLFWWSLLGGIVSMARLGGMYVQTIAGYLFHFGTLIVLVPLFYAFCRKNNRLSDKLITLVIILAVIESMVVLFQYLGTSVGDANDLRSITGTFQRHHAMVGNFMVIPIAYAFYRMIVIKVWTSRILYASLAILFLLSVILSTSRSILLGMVLGTLVTLVLVFKLSRKTFGLAFLFLAFLVAIVELTPLKIIVDKTISNIQNGAMGSPSEMGRILIWNGAIDFYNRTDFVTKLRGVGIGCYRYVPYRYFLDSGTKFASGAHNNYLHVMLETGLVGIILYLAHFVFLIRALLSFKKERVLARTFIFATLVLLMSALTQETFWFQPAFGDFWLFYGLNLAIVLAQISYSENGTSAQKAQS